MFSQSSALDQTRSHILQQISESLTTCLNSTGHCHMPPGSYGNGAAVLRLKNICQVGYGKINLSATQEQAELIGSVDGTTIPLSQKPPKDGNHYCDEMKRSDTQFHSILFDHSTIAIYSQTCRLLSSLKNSLIKISSFWKTQLIQVISLCSQLIKGRNYLTIKMSISITILRSHNLHELQIQIRNHKEMKNTI
ncbi:hypothetical protein VP01_4944g2, partial [Puccinia sorghi]